MHYWVQTERMKVGFKHLFRNNGTGVNGLGLLGRVGFLQFARLTPITSLTVVFAVGCLASNDAQAEIILKDSAGRTVNLTQPAQRIVSLSPSVTEMIFAVGGGDTLVAVTPYCSYPPEAMKIDKGGDSARPNVEKILSLQPDLVAASSMTPLAAVRQMEQLGIPVLAFSQQSLEHIYSDILLVGKAVGKESEGVALVEKLQSELKLKPSTRQGVENDGEIPSVLLLFDTQTLLSAGGNSYPNQIIERCGVVSITSSMTQPWPTLNRESLLTLKPDMLLVASWKTMSPEQQKNDSEKLLEDLKGNPWFSSLPAVTSNRVAIVGNNVFFIPGPRVSKAFQATLETLEMMREGSDE